MTGGSEPKPVMWGLSIVSWDWVAVAFGIIAVIALFLSATSANRRIAEANERASEANARAENARLEQERLKQIVKWRTIDPADLSALIAELAKGGGEIDLGYIPGDPESQYFALKIIGDAFIAANKSRGALKWHVYLRRWNSDAMFFGIAIPGPENERVTILRRAFQQDI